MKRALLKTQAFVRAAKRYVKHDSQRADAIRFSLGLLTDDAFDPRLRTHKLTGGLENCWAASGGYDLRIVFEFVQHNGVEAILLLAVGTHDEVY